MATSIKENPGTWLYRAMAIYFLWNIYLDVSTIDVIKSKIEQHDREIDKLQNAVFTQIWIKRSTPVEKERHRKETKMLEEITEDNIASAHTQMNEVDSLYKTN